MVFCVLRADNVPNPKGTFRVWGILFCFNQRFLGDWAHVNPQNCCPQDTMGNWPLPQKQHAPFWSFCPISRGPRVLLSPVLQVFRPTGSDVAVFKKLDQIRRRIPDDLFWGPGSELMFLCLLGVATFLFYFSFFGEVSTVFPEFCFSFPEGFLLWWFGSYDLRIVLQHTGRIKRRLVSCLTCFAALPIEVLLVVIGLQQFGLDAHEQSCGVDNIEHTAR